MSWTDSEIDDRGALVEQGFGDDAAVNLRGAVIDAEDAAVAIEALDRVS